MLFSDLHEYHVTTWCTVIQAGKHPYVQNKTPSLKNKAKAQKLQEYLETNVLSNEPQVIKEIMEI